MIKKTDELGSGLFEADLVEHLVRVHRVRMRPAFERLWDYYRNALDFGSGCGGRVYRAAQVSGLPDRLTRPGELSREVVVENDIAWRVHTLVDFMFGRPVGIESTARDPGLAAMIERALTKVFEANGGMTFFQDVALLGSVYGFVDLLLRVDRLPRVSGLGGSIAGPGVEGRAPSKGFNERDVLRYASGIVIEAVEAPRAIPLIDPSDYRRLSGYMVHYTRTLNKVERGGGVMSRLVGLDGVGVGRLATEEVTEQWSDGEVRVVCDGEVREVHGNPLGVLPVVHIQNLPQPFEYEGLSEVEPLIPLQDELNVRLSDRANRITMQSFKMYLGRGIENFLERPIGPGQMWMTENSDASIQEFGGDSSTPSEESHINEIREAMDKASAVSALAAGLLRNRVGNLTSANALRLVMMGLLARTEKKRVTYGQGIGRLCEMVLGAMDVAGVLKTEPEDRGVRLHWPSPIPSDTEQELKDAEVKLRLGIGREQVLAELGYDAQQREALAAEVE